MYCTVLYCTVLYFVQVYMGPWKYKGYVLKILDIMYICCTVLCCSVQVYMERWKYKGYLLKIYERNELLLLGLVQRPVGSVPNLGSIYFQGCALYSVFPIYSSSILSSYWYLVRTLNWLLHFFIKVSHIIFDCAYGFSGLNMLHSCKYKDLCAYFLR